MKRALNRRKTRVLVTAGPTRAYLDSVRYLSNLSTGRLGFEICRALKQKKCDVLLVSGPSACDFESLRLKKLVRVETNVEMKKAVMQICKSVRPDYAIFSAAVLDFVPARVQKHKVSSSEKNWEVKLVPSPKIITAVRKSFPEIKQITFKLENKMSWKKASALAERRLHETGAEAIVINFIEDVQGSAHPALLVEKPGGIKRFASKVQIAHGLARLVSQ